jgi:hypothetical protein
MENSRIYSIFHIFFGNMPKTEYKLDVVSNLLILINKKVEGLCSWPNQLIID